MQKGGFVYILTNPLHSVLYTGVTSDLISRMQQHIYKYYPDSFTAKYNASILVYYEFYSTINVAIWEEKRIKGEKRKQKLMLINTFNPSWNDIWVNEVSLW